MQWCAVATSRYHGENGVLGAVPSRSIVRYVNLIYYFERSQCACSLSSQTLELGLGRQRLAVDGTWLSKQGASYWRL